MAKFCPKCGTQLEEGAKFCPSCGEPIAAAQAQPEQTQQQYQQTPPRQEQYQQQNYQQVPPQGAQVPPQYAANDYTNRFHPQDIATHKGMSVLSYIGILVLIPFFAEKNSPYTRFHAVQGMYFFLCTIVLNVISGILGLVVRVPQTVFGVVYAYVTPWPVTLIQWLITICILTFMIIGIVYAATGKAKELPLIGKLTKLGWFK